MTFDRLSKITKRLREKGWTSLCAIFHVNCRQVKRCMGPLVPERRLALQSGFKLRYKRVRQTTLEVLM